MKANIVNSNKTFEEFKGHILKEIELHKHSHQSLNSTQLSKAMLGSIISGHQFGFTHLSSKIMYFMSSTFDDTKFEQDFLLEHVFPFLKICCKILHFDFNVVSMRWGVRSFAGNNHLTSDMCMRELYDCLNLSAGVAYITLQSHRYGYRPFPNTILAQEFECIHESIQKHLLYSPDIKYLEPPFWKRDDTSVPVVYRLQPVCSLPGCDHYLLTDAEKLRCKSDNTFKEERKRLQSQASSEWWKIFSTIQELLRHGIALSHLSLDVQCKEKYLISVTHDEVNRGIISNPNRNAQSLYFERTIVGIDDAVMTDTLAPTYKDCEWGPWGSLPRVCDKEVQDLHIEMKTQIRSVLSPSNVFDYTVPWEGGGS